jgi:hypothetical protein
MMTGHSTNQTCPCTAECACPAAAVPWLSGGLTLQPNTKFTILAPSDYAFASRLKQSLNMTAQELLKPEHRDTLVKVGVAYYLLQRNVANYTLTAVLPLPNTLVNQVLHAAAVFKKGTSACWRI